MTYFDGNKYQDYVWNTPKVFPCVHILKQATERKNTDGAEKAVAENTVAVIERYGLNDKGQAQQKI